MNKKKKEIPEIERLRSFKKRSGWSYQKLGQYMGIHSQTIYFWMSGKHQPSGLAFEKIRRFLRVYAY